MKYPDKSGVPTYTAENLNPSKFNLALVIPVINEGQRFLNQLKLISELKPNVDIIIADGGSTDGSTAIHALKQLGVTTILTISEPGKLSSQLRMAIHYVLNQNYLGLITMDGNGKDGVEGIPKFIVALNSGLDFVQGSRFIYGGKAVNTPFMRYLSIRFLHAPLTSIGAKYFYTDTTNGFRGHSRKLLEDPRVSPLRSIFQSYELIAYLPIRAGRLGFNVKEVPVTRSYPTNSKIPTKIRGINSHLKLIFILIKAILGHYNPK